MPPIKRVFPARKWNQWADEVERAFPYPGTNVRLAYHGEKGVAVTSDAELEFLHPWSVRPEWNTYPPERQTETSRGEWRAYFTPGFVNGRDAYIAQDEGEPAALTDEPAPSLALTDWRNPAAPAGLNPDAALAGEIRALPGEGYPAFFEALGVRPVAKGGRELEAPTDPNRTRELRALDIVLAQPRLGSARSVDILDPISTGKTHQLSTKFQNSYFVAMKGRATLRAVSKFVPFGDQFTTTAFLGLPMNAGDPQRDEIKIATVYAVSPPDVASEAVPDETWQIYTRYFVFWNLSHATRFVPPVAELPPVRLTTGLGAGLLDLLASAMLSPINAAGSEVWAFLNQSDMRGQFWTV